MLLQERNEFLFESPGPMVLTLIVDIRNGILNSRNRNAESAVAFLPRKMGESWKRIVNPFRRAALDQLQPFCNCDGGGKRK